MKLLQSTMCSCRVAMGDHFCAVAMDFDGGSIASLRNTGVASSYVLLSLFYQPL